MMPLMTLLMRTSPTIAVAVLLHGCGTPAPPMPPPTPGSQPAFHSTITSKNGPNWGQCPHTKANESCEMHTSVHTTGPVATVNLLGHYGCPAPGKNGCPDNKSATTTDNGYLYRVKIVDMGYCKDYTTADPRDKADATYSKLCYRVKTYVSGTLNAKGRTVLAESVWPALPNTLNLTASALADSKWKLTQWAWLFGLPAALHNFDVTQAAGKWPDAYGGG